MNNPFFFEPILKEKVWGGRWLETVLGKHLPSDAPYGESWEISGVPGDVSRPAPGQSIPPLDQLYSRDPRHLTGLDAPGPLFPLLYKFIDAQQRLSIQVHPDDAQAQANGWGRLGKTECWYILKADPGTQVIAGFRHSVTPEQIRDAVSHSRLIELLNFLDISAGDVILIPAGTVHANLSGTLLYEVQQTSDTTLRLYDWDRNDPRRPVQIEESIKIIDTGNHDLHKIPPIHRELKSGIIHGFRAVCRYFALEDFLFSRTAVLDLPDKRSFRVLTTLSGHAVLEWDGSRCPMEMGRSLLLPAAMGRFRVYGEQDTLIVLSSVPDLGSEFITPLRKAGIADSKIEQLGGNPRKNDLAPLLN